MMPLAHMIPPGFSMGYRPNLKRDVCSGVGKGLELRARDNSAEATQVA